MALRFLPIAILSLSMMFPASLLAQGFFVGPRVGMAMSSFWGDDADQMDDSTASSYSIAADNHLRIGVSAGGIIGYEFSDILSAQIECLFSMKGRNWESNILANFPIKGQTRLNYLEFPVLLRITAPLEGTIKPYAICGLCFSFLVDASEEINWNGIIRENNDANDEFNFFDFGLGIGGGVEFDAGPGGFFVEARYLAGFTTVDDITTSDQDKQDINNWLLTLSAGYLLRF